MFERKWIIFQASIFRGELFLFQEGKSEWGLRKIGHRIEAPSQGVGWGVLLGGPESLFVFG